MPWLCEEQIQVAGAENDHVEELCFEGDAGAGVGGLDLEEKQEDGDDVQHVGCKSEDIHDGGGRGVAGGVWEGSDCSEDATNTVRQSLKFETAKRLRMCECCRLLRDSSPAIRTYKTAKIFETLKMIDSSQCTTSELQRETMPRRSVSATRRAPKNIGAKQQSAQWGNTATAAT